MKTDTYTITHENTLPALSKPKNKTAPCIVCWSGTSSLGENIEVAMSEQGLYFFRSFGYNGYGKSWSKWKLLKTVEYETRVWIEYNNRYEYYTKEESMKRLSWGFCSLKRMNATPKHRLPKACNLGEFKQTITPVVDPRFKYYNPINGTYTDWEGEVYKYHNDELLTAEEYNNATRPKTEIVKTETKNTVDNIVSSSQEIKTPNRREISYIHNTSDEILQSIKHRYTERCNQYERLINRTKRRISTLRQTGKTPKHSKHQRRIKRAMLELDEQYDNVHHDLTHTNDVYTMERALARNTLRQYGATSELIELI